MFKFLSAISPIMILATEQAVPRIISLVGCDGSVCWMRWYRGGIDEHYIKITVLACTPKLIQLMINQLSDQII